MALTAYQRRLPHVAYHEAGHVAAALSLGFPVERVWIGRGLAPVLVRAWGRELRGLFAPGQRRRPAVEAAIRTGTVPYS